MRTMIHKSAEVPSFLSSIKSLLKRYMINIDSIISNEDLQENEQIPIVFLISASEEFAREEISNLISNYEEVSDTPLFMQIRNLSL